MFLSSPLKNKFYTPKSARKREHGIDAKHCLTARNLVPFLKNHHFHYVEKELFLATVNLETVEFIIKT